MIDKTKIHGAKALKQLAVVMREFKNDRLRSSSERSVTDVSQAKAIAMSEARTAQSRGTEMRTWKGRKRTRPKRKKRE